MRGIIKCECGNFFVVTRSGYVYVNLRDSTTSFVDDVTLTDGIERVYFHVDTFKGLIDGKYTNAKLRFEDGEAIAYI